MISHLVWTSVLILAIALGISPAARSQNADPAWTSCLHKPDESDKLIEACTEVIASGRASSEEQAIALNNRAATQEFSGGGSQDQVFRDYDEAIRLRPDIAKLYYNRGFARLRSGDAAKAIDDLDTAIRIDSRFAVAYGVRAEARLGEKLHDQAIRDCDEAIRLAPGYLHPLYNPYETRAQALEAKGDAVGAEAERQRYSKLSSRVQPKVPGPNVAGRRSWEPFLSK